MRLIHGDHHNQDETLPLEPTMDDRGLLLPLLKMADHASKTYQAISNQSIGYEWEHIGESVMDNLGLREFNYAELISAAVDISTGTQSML